MTHPLTYKIFEEIRLTVDEPGDGLIAYMRATYDFAVEKITEQWEEVINSNKTDIQVIRKFDKRLKAMRPQEES